MSSTAENTKVDIQAKSDSPGGMEVVERRTSTANGSRHLHSTQATASPGAKQMKGRGLGKKQKRRKETSGGDAGRGGKAVAAAAGKPGAQLGNATPGTREVKGCGLGKKEGRSKKGQWEKAAANVEIQLSSLEESTAPGVKAATNRRLGKKNKTGTNKTGGNRGGLQPSNQDSLDPSQQGHGEALVVSTGKPGIKEASGHGLRKNNGPHLRAQDTTARPTTNGLRQGIVPQTMRVPDAMESGPDHTLEELMDDALLNEPSLALNQTNAETSAITFLNSSANTSTNEGLAVATAITDESTRNLMQAEEVDPEVLYQKAIERKKNKQCIMVGLCLIATAIAVICGSIFGRAKSQNEVIELPELAPTTVPSMPPTESPSAAPSGSLDMMIAGLSDDTVERINRYASPQWKARKWLESHPNVTTMEEWRKIQLFALVTFFHSMHGESWRQAIQNDWQTYEKCECEWFSSEFGWLNEDGTYDAYLSLFQHNVLPCNDEKRYQSLFLWNLELEESNPTIPPEIALLTSLSILDLSHNRIEASLDTFLPTELYRMDNLSIVSLSDNEIFGTLPTEMGIASQSQIILSSNNLTGPLPNELAQMASIYHLSFSGNGLTGSIPSELGLLRSLRYLKMSGNRLTGSIPAELAHIDLYGLDVRDNRLDGFMPRSLCLLGECSDPLTYGQQCNFGLAFDCSNKHCGCDWCPCPDCNQSSHWFPSEQVDALFLQGQNHCGTLPSQLGLLNSMTSLFLQGNQFSGTIPTELSMMTNMTMIALNRNSLTGLIPSELGLMSSVIDLYLQENEMDGPLPTELGLMTHLTLLSLGSNSFTGSIPSQMGLMTSMGQFFLYANQLTGRISSELGLLTNMVQLFISQNRLSGPLPIELGLIASMKHLALGLNMLTGSIPTELGKMVNMTKLALGLNILSGSLPNELGLITNLEELFVDGNHLTSSIPSTFGLMTNLEILSLGSNSLSGTIPLELGSLVINGSLNTLILASNLLSGSVPAGLCLLGLYDPSNFSGLLFDCSGQLCGCCWCPCSDTVNYGDCDSNPGFVPSRDDDQWPGKFPASVYGPNAVAINIRADSYPDETCMDWRVLLDESGSWMVLQSECTHRLNSIHAYTHEVDSENLYMVGLHDSFGDGTCCEYGEGWFTITNSNPSPEFAGGSVIWEARGDALGHSLEIFVWVDADGLALVVEHFPGEGYGLVGYDSMEGDHIILAPEHLAGNSTN